jgi:hypothetical protein
MQLANAFCRYLEMATPLCRKASRFYFLLSLPEIDTRRRDGAPVLITDGHLSLLFP